MSLEPGAAPTYQRMYRPPAYLPPAYRPPALPNADGGADQPQPLAVPPELQGEPATTDAADPPAPFTPQPVTALGVWPTYRPAAVSADDAAPQHRLLDTSASEVVPPGAAPAPADEETSPVPMPAPAGDEGADAAPPYPSPPFQRPVDQAQAVQPPPAAPETDQPQADQPALPSGYLPPRQPAPAQPSYAPFRAPPAAPPAAPPPQSVNPFTASPPPGGATDGYYANPFRPPPAEAPAAQADTAVPAPALPAAAPDPETEEIDRNIAALRDAVAPSAQAGFGYRSRSGSSGLDALDAATLPMEATYSPGGYGQVKLTVTPTLLSSGSIGGGVTNQQRFGTQALGLSTNGATGVTTLAGASAGDQNAQGVGLDAAYSMQNFKLDVGSSPFGFREQNVVGGAEWAPQLSDHVRLRLLAERRAVPDSILAFAGTVDPRTGQTWGGVVQDHARATLEFSAGKADFYALGGWATFTGTHVQNNSEFEAGAGASFRPGARRARKSASAST